MKPALFGILIILVLIVAGAYFYAKDLFMPAPVPEVGATGMNLYANGTYGISFAYPGGYEVAEKQVGDDASHYAIVLVRAEDMLVPEGGEGPRAITIDIYTGEEGGDLFAWLSSSNSNLSLGSGTYASTTVGGIDAARYQWEGLYLGETAAFAHEDTVVAVSVTSDGPVDQIRADYEAILASFTLR